MAAADPAPAVKQVQIPYILSLSQPKVEIQEKSGSLVAELKFIGPILFADPYNPPRPILYGDGRVEMRIARLAKTGTKHRMVCEAKGPSALRFVQSRDGIKVNDIVAKDEVFGGIEKQFAFDFLLGDNGVDTIAVTAETPSGDAWQFGRCRVTAGLAPASEPQDEVRTPELKSLAVLQTKPYRISAAQPKVQVLTGFGAIRAGILSTSGYIHYSQGNQGALLTLNGNGSDVGQPATMALLIARITPNKLHRLACDLSGRENFSFNHSRAKPGIKDISSIADTVPFKQVMVKPDSKGLQSYEFFVGDSGQDVITLRPETRNNFPFFVGCDVSLVP